MKTTPCLDYKILSPYIQRRRQESKISEVEGGQPKEVPKNFFQIQNFAKDFTIFRGVRALLVTPASATAYIDGEQSRWYICDSSL
jgi:hypothetical protein